MPRRVALSLTLLAALLTVVLGLLAGCERVGKVYSDYLLDACGGQMVFGLDGTQIWMMDANGSNARRLAEGRSPAWSPDCKKIAFVKGVKVDRADVPPASASSYGGAPTETGSVTPADMPPRVWLPYIFVMNANGSNQQQLLDKNALNLTWSPDGRQIAFERGAIFVIDANGWGRLRPLTTFEASEPAWSPDGKQIAFERDRDIYVMNADGTEPTNLTNTSEDEASPSWSPDGSEIAFIRSGESYNNGVYNYSTDLYKIDADGSGDTRLIQDDVGGYPTWSPDGTKIAFMRGGTAIYTIDSDGSNLTLVRRFPGHPVGPLNWR